MSGIFSRLLEEGQRQQAQLHEETPLPTQSPKQPKQVVFETPSDDSVTARQQPVQTASRHDSTTARQPDSTLDYVSAFLQAKAINKTTLRYPPSLMGELEDVLYQIKKTHGTALSKNEVFVLALAHILWDFKQNASRSLLFQKLIQIHEK